MLIEGSSLRSISRVTSTGINTVSKFVVDAGNACAALHDEAVVNVPGICLPGDSPINTGRKWT